jgi:alanine dehydrogenase
VSTGVRSDCLVPSKRNDGIYSLKSMDAVIPGLGVGAVRIDSDIVTWPKQGANIRRLKVPLAHEAEAGLSRFGPQASPRSIRPAK